MCRGMGWAIGDQVGTIWGSNAHQMVHDCPGSLFKRRLGPNLKEVEPKLGTLGATLDLTCAQVGLTKSQLGPEDVKFISFVKDIVWIYIYIYILAVYVLFLSSTVLLPSGCCKRSQDGSSWANLSPT